MRPCYREPRPTIDEMPVRGPLIVPHRSMRVASPAKKPFLELVPRRGLWTKGAGEERIGERLSGQGAHEDTTDIDGGSQPGHVGHRNFIARGEVASPSVERLELLTDIQARLRTVFFEALSPGLADPLRADAVEKMGHRHARKIGVEDLPGILFQVIEPETRHQELNPEFLVNGYAIECKKRVLDAYGVGHFRSRHGTGPRGARRKQRRHEQEKYDRLGNGVLAVVEASGR